MMLTGNRILDTEIDASRVVQIVFNAHLVLDLTELALTSLIMFLLLLH